MMTKATIAEGELKEDVTSYAYHDQYSSRTLKIDGFTIATGRDDYMQSDLDNYVGCKIRIEVIE